MKTLKSDLLIHANSVPMISINFFLLQKCFYSYEYMDYLEKLNERSLPEKEDFSVIWKMLRMQTARTEKEFQHGNEF